MFTTKKINDVEIKPVKIPKIKTDNILGHELFDSLYFNCLILARKNSGKTVLLARILEACANKFTKVVIFSATHHKCQVMQKIKEELERRQIISEFHESIIDDKGVNLLALYMEALRAGTEDEEEKPPDLDYYYDPIDGTYTIQKSAEKEISKIKKPTVISPEYLFIFDDQSGSNGLLHPTIEKFTKEHRHLRTRCFYSSQAAIDLRPSAIKQMDFVILFPGFDLDKLESIHTHVALSLPLEEFIKLYHDATAERFNFLYIDCVKNKYRKNFNLEYII